MTKQIMRVEIYYSDNSQLVIDNYELTKMEKLSDAIQMIERARTLYLQLKTMFAKHGDVK